MLTRRELLEPGRRYRVWPLLLGTLLALILYGCEKDRSLPNGYQIFIANSSDVVILAPRIVGVSDAVVGPRVWRIGVKGDIVYGEVVDANSKAWSPPSRGFFILDTKTGEKDDRLERGEWEAELRRRGVESIRLRNP